MPQEMRHRHQRLVSSRSQRGCDRREVQPRTVAGRDAEPPQQPHVPLVFAVPPGTVADVEQAVDRVAQERAR